MRITLWLLLGLLLATRASAEDAPHTFVLHDRQGRALPFLAVRLARLGAPLDASSRYDDVYSDEAGRVALLPGGKRAYRIEVELPLLAKPQRLTVPRGARTVVLRDVDVVHCAFATPSGQRASWAGWSAVATLRDGSKRRASYEPSDVLRPWDVLLAWPRDAITLEVHAPGFVQAELHASGERCVLRTTHAR